MSARRFSFQPIRFSEIAASISFFLSMTVCTRRRMNFSSSGLTARKELKYSSMTGAALGRVAFQGVKLIEDF